MKIVRGEIPITGLAEPCRMPVITVFISSNPSGGVFPVIGNGVTGTCFDIQVAHGADLIIQNGGTLNVINP